MHFVMSYDLRVPAGTRRKELEQRIADVINPCKNVSVLSSFFIIHVDDKSDWERIRKGLTEISTGIKETFYFVMSPLMDGGKYNGWLPNESWGPINEITNLD